MKMLLLMFNSLFVKPGVPKLLQNKVVHKINFPRCYSTVRHLHKRFKEHVGNKGPLRTHFETNAF